MLASDRSSDGASTSMSEPRGIPFPRRGAETSEDQSPFPALGTAGPTRVKGGVQAFAERFHREGLPIARLWENKSALVSFGLNQRGKAGLWLVQKTH
jgi:hypothetical protein